MAIVCENRISNRVAFCRKGSTPIGKGTSCARSVVKLIPWAAVILPLLAQGQSYRENTSNEHLWVTCVRNEQFSKRLGVHVEGQLRRSDLGDDWQQLLLRTGLDFHAAGARFTVGYAFVETYPYGDFPVANAFPEHRIWEQALLKQSFGILAMSHRYRLEQRFLGNAATGEFSNGRYENRFRYMLRVNVPLGGKKLEPKKSYLGFADEIMINFGDEVKYNLFDQNRLMGLLGYSFSNSTRLEIGYMLQTVKQRSLFAEVEPVRNIIENNHTVMVSVVMDIKYIERDRL
jgi:Protein of unknown function (DUF2490)